MSQRLGIALRGCIWICWTPTSVAKPETFQLGPSIGKMTNLRALDPSKRLAKSETCGAGAGGGYCNIFYCKHEAFTRITAILLGSI